jgi:hypothetical protein
VLPSIRRERLAPIAIDQQTGTAVRLAWSDYARETGVATSLCAGIHRNSVISKGRSCDGSDTGMHMRCATAVGRFVRKSD